MRSFVITGTSPGIGWGTTKVLIEQGFRVFGSVRKTSEAERLSREFGNRFVPLLFNVTDEAAVTAAAADVRIKPLLVRLIDCLPVHNLDDDRSTRTGHDATDCGLAQKS